MAKLFLMAASLSGFLGVAIGAFGAHSLKQKISDEMMAVYQTGVQYHFYHTLALLGVGILLHQFPQSLALKLSAWGMLIGMLVFSGSLYLLALSGTRWLGARRGRLRCVHSAWEPNKRASDSCYCTPNLIIIIIITPKP